MGFRADKPWNGHVSTSFLRYWRDRATVVYLQEVAGAKADGSRTKGNLAQIALLTQILHLIHGELRRRGAQ